MLYADKVSFSHFNFFSLTETHDPVQQETGDPADEWNAPEIHIAVFEVNPFVLLRWKTYK